MMRVLFTLLTAIGFVGCTSHDPEPIHIGQDTCEHCRMTISDPKFGGEIIYKTGKVVKFDALICAAAHQAENKDKVEKVFTLDFNNPGKLIDVTKAFFLQSKTIRGPMGADLLGTETESGVKDLSQKFPGKVMKWEEAQKILNAN